MMQPAHTIMPAEAQAQEQEADWTFRKACEFLDRSAPFVYEQIREGRIKAYKVGNRTMLDPASVRTFARSKPLVLPPKAEQPKSKPKPPARKGKRAA